MKPLSEKQVLMLYDKDDGTNLEDSKMVIPTKDVREAVQEFIQELNDLEGLPWSWLDTIEMKFKEIFGDLAE